MSRIVRTNFISGRLLSADDLRREQEYFRDKLKRHNRTLHGFGVVSGLDLSRKGDKLFLEPGMALDCLGNEIINSEQQELATPVLTDPSQIAAFVALRYAERTDAPPDGSLIEEGFEALLQSENTNRNHRHLHGRWLPCGEPHPLTIAKLRLTSGRWRIDRRYNPPRIK
jgi:hypothetical protein